MEWLIIVCEQKQKLSMDTIRCCYDGHNNICDVWMGREFVVAFETDTSSAIQWYSIEITKCYAYESTQNRRRKTTARDTIRVNKSLWSGGEMMRIEQKLNFTSTLHSFIAHNCFAPSAATHLFLSPCLFHRLHCAWWWTCALRVRTDEERIVEKNGMKGRREREELLKTWHAVPERIVIAVCCYKVNVRNSLRLVRVSECLCSRLCLRFGFTRCILPSNTLVLFQTLRCAHAAPAPVPVPVPNCHSIFNVNIQLVSSFMVQAYILRILYIFFVIIWIYSPVSFQLIVVHVFSAKLQKFKS